MADGPLDKPAHLRPADSSASGLPGEDPRTREVLDLGLRPAVQNSIDGPRAWLAQRPAGLAAAALGLLSFIVVAISSGQLWVTPDWRISVPCFVVTAAAACVSVARRERGAYPLWLLGVGLAGAALVLGWFLMVAIVIGATAILMLILHALM